MEKLTGYKGASFIDTGYYFVPYIPMSISPVVLDPNVFIPNAGILTRYGKKLLEEGKKYYGTLELNDKVTKPRYRSITDPWEISAEAE